MAERNFDAERKTSREGHTFILAGKTFHVLSGLPVSVMLESTQEPSFEGVVKFVRQMIVKTDRAMFDSLIAGDEDVIIDANELIEVSNWILEVISDRPTGGSASSSTGSDATSATSGVTPIAKAATGK